MRNDYYNKFGSIFFKKSFLPLLLLSLSACSSQYIAPGLEENQGALVNASKDTSFTAIDGDSIGDKTSLRLPSGAYKVDVRAEFPRSHMGSSPFVVNRQITMRVEDGKEYALMAKRSGAGNWHYIWVADSKNEDLVVGGKKPRGPIRREQNLSELEDIEFEDVSGR